MHSPHLQAKMAALHRLATEMRAMMVKGGKKEMVSEAGTDENHSEEAKTPGEQGPEMKEGAEAPVSYAPDEVREEMSPMAKKMVASGFVLGKKKK